MASSIIHMCVAKELNKKLNRDEELILLGSIAPDLSQYTSLNRVSSRNKSHFGSDTVYGRDLCNLNEFKLKYKNYLEDDFLLGYYIHLYTDNIWLSIFLKKFTNYEYITKKNNTIIRLYGNMFSKYIYNDYLFSNNSLLNKYNIDKSFFNKKRNINYTMDEINFKYLNEFIDNINKNLNDKIKRKALCFDLDDLLNFIELCVSMIEEDLKYIKKNEKGS